MTRPCCECRAILTHERVSTFWNFHGVQNCAECAARWRAAAKLLRQPHLRLAGGPPLAPPAFARGARRA